MLAKLKFIKQLNTVLKKQCTLGLRCIESAASRLDNYRYVHSTTQIFWSAHKMLENERSHPSCHNRTENIKISNFLPPKNLI